MLRVVFKGYVKALQARGDGVVASAEGMVGALVKADGSINAIGCLLYTSPSPRDRQKSRMPSSA